MQGLYSTRQVAGFLDIKPGTLQKAIWQNQVKPPSKGPSGQYLWTKADIERAAWALHLYENFAKWQAALPKTKGVPTMLGGQDEAGQ